MSKLHQIPELTAITDDDLLLVMNDPANTQATRKITVANMAASETKRGLVELATSAEALAGMDTQRAVTPAGLKAALGYTEYVALLTQSGTNAPSATVVKNDTGATVSYAFGTTGAYVATFSAAVLTTDKTIVILAPKHYAGQQGFSIVSTNVINISTANASGIPSNGILNATPFIVRIYI